MDSTATSPFNTPTSTAPPPTAPTDGDRAATACRQRQRDLTTATARSPKNKTLRYILLFNDAPQSRGSQHAETKAPCTPAAALPKSAAIQFTTPSASSDRLYCQSRIATKPLRRSLTHRHQLASSGACLNPRPLPQTAWQRHRHRRRRWATSETNTGYWTG